MRTPPVGLSRERCGKQSTRWRRRPGRRQRHGEAGGAGKDSGTAAPPIPPRPFCARAGGIAVLPSFGGRGAGRAAAGPAAPGRRSRWSLPRSQGLPRPPPRSGGCYTGPSPLSSRLSLLLSLSRPGGGLGAPAALQRPVTGTEQRSSSVRWLALWVGAARFCSPNGLKGLAPRLPQRPGRCCTGRPQLGRSAGFPWLGLGTLCLEKVGNNSKPSCSSSWTSWQV